MKHMTDERYAELEAMSKDQLIGIIAILEDHMAAEAHIRSGLQKALDRANGR